MKNSFFINILSLILLLSACAPLKPGKLEKVRASEEFCASFDGGTGRRPAALFGSAFEKGLFKASIDIRDNHLSGLLFIKKIQDSAELLPGKDSPVHVPAYHRIVFCNEMGMTFFDLGIGHEGHDVIFCFEPLNRKGLLNVLETAFRILLASGDIPDQSVKYIQTGTGNRVCSWKTGKITQWNMFSPACDTLLAASGRSNFADGTQIRFQTLRDGYPSRIEIENPLVKLRISLAALNPLN
jgi:hypothetical protein